jgi:hypothetical protein
MRRLVLLSFLVCMLATVRASGQEASPIPWVSDQELIQELKDAPHTYADRTEKLVALFQQAGLTEVKKQEATSPGTSPPAQLANVIALLPGKSPECIVVGAHTDFTMGGMGVIDDWSGASMLANIAQTLGPLPRNHTFLFIGFTLEEAGAVGSSRYVRRLSLQEKNNIRAMVNLDCLGVSKTFLWRTGSADALEALASRVAADEKVALTARQLTNVGADSDAFMAAGIPAITFDSLTAADFDLIDSPRDRFEAINPANYVEQYHFLVHYLLALDQMTEPIDPANKDRPPMALQPGFQPDLKRLRAEGTIVVVEVVDWSPEKRAGLQPGDVVVKFGGVTVNSADDFVGRFVTVKAGDKVAATVKRDGKEVELEIQY